MKANVITFALFCLCLLPSVAEKAQVVEPVVEVLTVEQLSDRINEVVLQFYLQEKGSSI